MLGKIVRISQEKQIVLILGNDKKQYIFRFSEWCEDEVIRIGSRVEFDIAGEKRANNVFLAETAPPAVNPQSNQKLSGKIIKISNEKKLALILGNNRNQYVFRLQDWQEQCTPEINMQVCFELLNEKQAYCVKLEDEFDSFEENNAFQHNRESHSQPELDKDASYQTGSHWQSNQEGSHWQADKLHDKENGRLLMKLEEPSLKDYIVRNFIQFKIAIKGRASVKELWSCTLFSMFFIIAVQNIGKLTDSPSFALILMIFPGLYIQLVMLTVQIRRLHDLNISGWAILKWLIIIPSCFAFFFAFILANAIPDGSIIVIAFIVSVFIYILCFASLLIRFFFINDKQVENEFGRSPAYDYAD